MLYLGRYGNSKHYKLGETQRPKKRLIEIRCGNRYANAKRFRFINLQADTTTKVEDVFIEGYIRMKLEHKGFKILGNDHFDIIMGYNQDDVEKLWKYYYDEALKMALDRD